MPNTKLCLTPLLAILLVISQSANATPQKLCDRPPQDVRIAPIQIGSVAVFGELHGTQETPDFIRQVVCSELSHGRRVVVGLEAYSSLATDLPGTEPDSIPFSYEKFADHPFWNRTALSQDGRSSESMWSLWIDLIARQLDTGDVVVAPIETKNTHPTIDKFVALLTEQPNSTGVMLVGNYHARTGASNNLLKGLATFSQQAGRTPTVRNYLMLYSTGSAWNCSIECGTRRTSMPIAFTLRKGAYLLADANVTGVATYLDASIPLLREYGGFYWLDTVTPSPPHKSR